jgi:hypothetical protein
MEKTTKLKHINILPDRTLIPKIGYTGYSVSQAIAELVDNSVDARRDGELLTVEINLFPSQNEIEVSDDGIGMDEETAANSIRLAHSDKADKLGEFGLGLKTAASSLGKTFEITTTQRSSAEQYMLEYDEDRWLRDGDWTKFEMRVKSGIDQELSGTVIRIKNLRFKIYPNLPGNVRTDLATRFAPFIETGEVRIKVNTKWCVPQPLELKQDYCLPDGKEPFRMTLESGSEVWGWRGLLRRGSEKGEYGFRVFRRGRLILQHAKIGFNPHPESRQIVGELHVDHLPVTHNKREFIQSSMLYQELVKEDGVFWNFMRDLVREARSSIRKTQIDQGILEKIASQKENLMRAIKSLPELKEYAFPDHGILSQPAHDPGTDSKPEKVIDREIVTIEEHHVDVESSDKSKRQKRSQTRRTYYITIHGKKFRVEHSFVDLKTEDVLKDKLVDHENGIQVFTNISFPAFANTKDHVFYGVWNIAEAIAEVMVDMNQRPAMEILKIRDLILRKTAEITRELDDIERERKAAERLKKEYEERMARISEIEQKHLAIKI